MKRPHRTSKVLLWVPKYLFAVPVKRSGYPNSKVWERHACPSACQFVLDNHITLIVCTNLQILFQFQIQFDTNFILFTFNFHPLWIVEAIKPFFLLFYFVCFNKQTNWWNKNYNRHTYPIYIEFFLLTQT